jgi:hypothetical protein
MENLGDLLQLVGRPEEAQEYYLRAEAGVRLVYGSESKRCQEIVSKLNHSKGSRYKFKDRAAGGRKVTFWRSTKAFLHKLPNISF